MKIYDFSIIGFRPNLLPFLFLATTVLYNFSVIFFGLDFTDSFYHLNQAIDPADGVYLYPFFLSSVIIKGFIELVGPNIIHLRTINWLLLFFSLLLPFFFLKVYSNRFEFFFYIACGLILITPFNANILGYDTLSIFINSFLFAVTALYLKSRAFYLIVVLSFLCAVAIFIRFPNGLAVPIVFIFVLVSEKLSGRGRGLKIIERPVIFLILTLLLLFFGYSLYYTGLDQFVGAFSNSESHNILFLLKNYFKDGIETAGFVVLLLLLFLLYKKVIARASLLQEGILIVLFIVFLLYFVGYSKFAINYSLFLVAMVISIVVIQTYYNRKDIFSFEQLILYLLLLFLFINPFGSNTGLLKAYSLFLLLPFVLTIIDLKCKKFWLLLFVVLVPFSVLIKFYGIYEDKSLFHLDEKLELKKLSPIRTNSVRKEYLERTDAVVQQLSAQGVDIYFYGDKSHIFHYLYQDSSINISSFFQPVDEITFFPEIKEVLRGKNRVAVFIVDSYPERESSRTSFMEQEIIRNGLKKEEDGSVKYYLWDPDKDH